MYEFTVVFFCRLIKNHCQIRFIILVIYETEWKSFIRITDKEDKWFHDYLARSIRRRCYRNSSKLWINWLFVYLWICQWLIIERIIKYRWWLINNDSNKIHLWIKTLLKKEIIYSIKIIQLDTLISLANSVKYESYNWLIESRFSMKLSLSSSSNCSS